MSEQRMHGKHMDIMVPAAKNGHRKRKLHHRYGIFAVHHHFWAVVAVISLITVLAAGIGYHVTHRPIISADIRQRTSFPLYEPSWLPPGFSVARNSVSATADVVTYALHSNGAKVTISEQPRPNKFDYDYLYEQIGGGQPTDTPIGTMVTGQFQGTPFISVVSDKTWLLIRSTDGVDRRHLETMVRSMRSQ